MQSYFLNTAYANDCTFFLNDELSGIEMMKVLINSLPVNVS